VDDLEAKAVWLKENIEEDAEEYADESWDEYCGEDLYITEINDAFLPYLWKRLTVAFFQVDGKDIVGEFQSLADIFEKFVVDPAQLKHVSVYSVDCKRKIIDTVENLTE
jgi:hypothetical protein